MTISKEQVADLREGDVVEMSWSVYGGQVTVRGPLVAGSRELLSVAGYWVREPDGAPIQGLDRGGRRTLTVVSRAPRPLYVNHPRTEPAPGDVVRDDSTDWACTWVFEDPLDPAEPWRHHLGQLCRTHQVRWTNRSHMPARLRLLVDGETGQVVP